MDDEPAVAPGLRLATWSSAALVAIVAGLLVVVGDVEAAQWISNAGYVVAAGASGAMALVGARRRAGAERRAWFLIAGAQGCWLVANAIWAWYESIADRSIPVPSVFDLFYGAAMVLLLIGIGLLVAPVLRASSPTRLLLDALLVASSMFYVAWVALLGDLPALDWGAELAVTWAYPVFDVALACIAILALARSVGAGRASWQLLAGAVLVLAVADSIWAWGNLQGGFESGNVADALWLAGYLAIGLAALVPRSEAVVAPTTVAERWTALVPYVPFLLVIVTSAASYGRPPDPVRTIAVLLTVGLLGVRQVVAVLENQRLARELEVRVASRTAQLAKSEALFRAVGHTISDAVLVLDADMTLRDATPGLRGIAGFGREDLIGRGILHLVHPDDVAAVIVLAEAVASVPGSTHQLHCRVRVADGTYGRAEVTMANLLDHPDIRGHLLAIRDVSEQHALQERLIHRAEHDELTGLVNRATLGERVTELLAAGRSPAIVLLDLDGFKALNDSLGHAVGDELLRAVAVRLRESVRPGDVVARLGGDEFAVVVDGATGDATGVAARIVADLDRPLTLRGRAARCRASVGVATIGGTAEELLRNADLAMYEAKAQGRNRVELFHDGMHARLLRTVWLEEALRGAIERDELDLAFQPVVDLLDGRLLGAEALLRWEHGGETIEPAEFVAIAEDTGQIVAIGRWVLTRACAAAARWQELRPDGPLPRLAVNVSAHQLMDADLVGDVRGALDATGLEPACLTIEVTESAVMEHSEEVAGRLAALRHLGVRISIDDFGTGYSSLARLEALPVDEIKIDRSFVGAIERADQVAPVVDAVLALARSLGLEVVAEGIETDAQRRSLARAGCTAAQGYLFGPAATADDIARWLAGELDNKALNFSV